MDERIIDSKLLLKQAQEDVSSDKILVINSDGLVGYLDKNDIVAGSVVWGDVQGSITNQTDLQTELDQKEDVFTKNTAFNKNFGTVAGTVTQGNDSRVDNGQTAFSWGDHSQQGYLTTEQNDLTQEVTWANVPDNFITQSSVTQHESDLTITESQISDLGSYDNYQSWNLKTNGVQRTTIQSQGDLDITEGANVDISYGAGGVVTINSVNTDTNDVDYISNVGLTGTNLEFTGTGNAYNSSVNLNPILNGYATESWVNSKGFLTDVPTLQEVINEDNNVNANIKGTLTIEREGTNWLTRIENAFPQNIVISSQWTEVGNEYSSNISVRPSSIVLSSYSYVSIGANNPTAATSVRANLSTALLTSPQYFEFPDKSGTIALEPENSGVYKNITTVDSGNYTVTEDDYIIIHRDTSSAVNTITIPAASTCEGRIIRVITWSKSKTFNINYLNMSGNTSNNVLANSHTLIQSDGTDWYLIS